jgi:large subunit ribosomal protein L9
MAAMEMILLKDVDNLGYADDIVKVKPGYGRNFLLPKKIAVSSNITNKKILAERLRVKAKKEEAMLSKINDIKASLAKLSFKIEAKAGANEKIFGSITTHHIQDAIKANTGLEIERRKISIVEGVVKNLGAYTAKVDLAKEHSVEIPFEVIGVAE